MADVNEDAAYGTTIGDRLRQAREAKGLTLDDVASETRIPIRHLRNIEDSNWADMPAVTYMVGFARSYANAVGLDGPEIARELREQVGHGDRPSSVSPEIYAPTDPARVPSRSLAWGAGIALIVLIAAWLLVIRPYLTRSEDEPAAPPAAETAPPADQPIAIPPPQPQSLAGQPVTLVATADTWMSITDRGASNRRLYYSTLRSGERFQVPADATRPVIQTTNPQNLRVLIGDQDRGPLAAERRRVNDLSLLAADLAGQGATPQPGGTTPPQPAAPTR